MTTYPQSYQSCNVGRGHMLARFKRSITETVTPQREGSGSNLIEIPQRFTHTRNSSTYTTRRQSQSSPASEQLREHTTTLQPQQTRSGCPRPTTGSRSILHGTLSRAVQHLRRPIEVALHTGKRGHPARRPNEANQNNRTPHYTLCRRFVRPP